MKTVGNRMKIKLRSQDHNWLAKKNLTASRNKLSANLIVTRLAHFSNKSAMLSQPACVHLRKNKRY